jgi:hypothetical protein
MDISVFVCMFFLSGYLNCGRSEVNLILSGSYFLQSPTGALIIHKIYPVSSEVIQVIAFLKVQHVTNKRSESYFQCFNCYNVTSDKIV